MSKLINKTTIENKIAKLTPKQVTEIQSVLTDACLAIEYGTDYRPIILRAKNKHRCGKLKSIYDFLGKLDSVDMETIAKVFIEPPEKTIK